MDAWCMRVGMKGCLGFSKGGSGYLVDIRGWVVQRLDLRQQEAI